MLPLRLLPTSRTMRRRAAFIVCLLLAAAFFACQRPLFAGRQRPLLTYNLNFQLSQTNFVDTIAIDWERHQVLVPVTIGGRQYRFLFDTGASQCVVYDDAPIEGCRHAGHIPSYDAIGRRDTVEVVTLPPMTIGSTTFTGCQATVQHRTVRRHDIDGIVGFSLIAKGLSAKIDVRRQHLILTDRRDFFSRETGYTERYRLNYNVPYVRVNPFGRYTEQVMFDTGSRQFYAINATSFQRATARRGADATDGVQLLGRAFGRQAIGFSGAEPAGELLRLKLSVLPFGDFLFTDVVTATTRGGSHLGAAMLDYGTLTILPHRRQLCFQPYDGGNLCAVRNEQPDIAFVDADGQPAVGMVVEGSTPYQRGFRPGDVIISIDDRPVSSFFQFVGWGFEQGREYRFLVRHQGGLTEELRWVRRPLTTKE